MTCRRILFVVLAFVGLMQRAALEARQKPDLESAVAQHYPQVLVDGALESRGVEPAREQCFAVILASPTGAPVAVIAAYTNLTSGAVRLLRAVGSGFEVAAQGGTEYFSGTRCEAEAVDVNNDGRKEGVVHFLSRNSTQDWLFDWDGEILRSLTPTMTSTDGLVETRLVNTSLIDINGDDVLEAFTFSEPPQEGPPAPSQLYRLSGGSYVLDRPIVGMRSFERGSGASDTQTQTILLPIGAVGPFTLRIINGAGSVGSGKRVERGQVWWNGQEIVRPNQFGKHADVIERTVTLRAENELKVRLSGSAGERMVVIIDAARWTP